jgi:hypothetical protein
MLHRVSCLLAAACAAGSVHAALVPSVPLTSPAPALESVMPEVNCVNGFSKDYCDGIVYPGEAEVSGCITPIPEGSCRTVRIKGATLVFNTFSNNQVCGSSLDETCDETRNGRFKLSSNFTIRLHKHCPYRGCWDGVYGEFVFQDGSTYAGTLMGTVGVGTHRPSTAPSICAISPSSRDCERCYDVSFGHGQVRIGYEAAFHGKRIDADTGQELCFSLSGDFLVPVSTTGEPDWTAEWRAVGTADGIHLTFCP